jgi:putative redox protein
MNIQSKKLIFKGKSGNAIAAQLDTPQEGAPQGIVLFAHCFTCSKNLNSVNYISKALVQQQFGVFRFDFTGLGESEGDFSDTNFSTNIEDLIEAAAYLKKEYMAPSILLGHSLGGAAVLAAAGHIPGWCIPCSPHYWRCLLVVLNNVSAGNAGQC